MAYPERFRSTCSDTGSHEGASASALSAAPPSLSGHGSSVPLGRQEGAEGGARAHMHEQRARGVDSAPRTGSRLLGRAAAADALAQRGRSSTGRSSSSSCQSVRPDSQAASDSPGGGGASPSCSAGALCMTRMHAVNLSRGAKKLEADAEVQEGAVQKGAGLACRTAAVSQGAGSHALDAYECTLSMRTDTLGSSGRSDTCGGGTGDPEGSASDPALVTTAATTLTRSCGGFPTWPPSPRSAEPADATRMHCAADVTQLARQLDAFSRHDRLLGRYEVLGRFERRLGGARPRTHAVHACCAVDAPSDACLAAGRAAVQFVAGADAGGARRAVKFFVDMDAFCRESAVLGAFYPHLRTSPALEAAARRMREDFEAHSVASAGAPTHARHAAPRLSAILPSAHMVYDRGVEGLVDPSGHPLPPCIVMERGENLQEWTERTQPDLSQALTVR
jgi:hypothetical protein